MLTENNLKINSESQDKSCTKPNCYILTGDKVKELFINQKSIGSKDKTAFNVDFGWCFYEKKDAEKIADKYSKKIGCNIAVVRTFCETARRKWHGTKLEKKAAGLETRYFLTKRDVDAERTRIADCFYKESIDAGEGLDISYLYNDSPSKELSPKQKKAFEFYKLEFEKWKTAKEDCEELKKELDAIEKEINDAGKSPVSNPNDWPFKVLGYNNKREIILWHQGDLMLIPVKQLSKRDLQLLMGPSVVDAEDAIIAEAYRKGKIYDDKPLKSGVWKFKDKWLIISGKQAAVIDKNGIKSLDYPVFEDKIIKFESKDWINWDHFNSVFGKITLSEIYNKIKNRVSAWNWTHKSMAEYITAFVLLSPIQQAMSWRPWLHLTGARGTGKSSFFEYILQALFSSQVQKLDKSTAHAAAQSVGNTGKIPQFDEFEKNKHIPDILEMFKLANTGGVKTSGTPGEKPLEFDLHHMPWFGSIYLPKQVSQDSAQESRIIKLELKKLQDSSPLLEKIESEDGSKLAAEIVASMIFQWNEIEFGSKDIAKKRIHIMKRLPGTQIRTIDNFMYASSLLNIALGTQYDVPEWVNTNSEDDGDKIINIILSSMIRVVDDTYTIGDCIERARGEQTTSFAKALENVGIKHTTRNGIRYLAFRSANIVRFLLKDTDYKDSDIQAPLSRIEGAIPSHPVKFSGKQERCVLVPIDIVMGEPSIDSNQRNHSVTPSVTPEILNNERDIYTGYGGYTKSYDDEKKENEQIDLFDEKVCENANV